MKRTMFFWGVLVWILPATPLHASGVTVSDAWVREAPPSVQTLAAYMILRNTGTVGKTMVSANSPYFAKVELHETVHQGDMTTMTSRKRLVIGANDQVSLQPHGYHLMLVAPQTDTPLQVGDPIPLILHFDDGSRMTINATVRKKPPGNGSRP